MGGVGGAWGWLLGGAGAASSLHWIVQCAAVWLRDTREIDLTRLPLEEPPGGWPTVAIAFAARDEAESVEMATRSLLAQDYPRLEVIAVDDRSTDRTAAILDGLAAADARLTVVHVTELPGGWLGKTHALQQAFDRTTAEWVLFTDADVVMAPDVLRRAVSLAVRGGFDQLAAAPGVPSETVGERVFLAVFMTIFLVVAAPILVESAWCKAAIGIGAFNLIRTASLRSLGGFARIRLSVDDDMRLGQMIKWNGGRCRMLNGKNAVNVRWQIGLWGFIRGLEKNFFAAQEYKSWVAPLGVFGIAFFVAGPHLGLLADNWTRWVNLAGVAGICGVLAKVGVNSRVSWYYGLLMPLGGAALIVAMARSAWLTLRRGGVVWRDHLYPLEQLREHVAERKRWLDGCWKKTRGRAPDRAKD